MAKINIKSYYIITKFNKITFKSRMVNSIIYSNLLFYININLFNSLLCYIVSN